MFHTSAHIDPILPVLIVEEFILSPWIFFFKNVLTIEVWVHFWDFCSILLIFRFIFVPIPAYFNYNCPVVHFKTGIVLPLALFLFKISLIIWALFNLRMSVGFFFYLRRML